MFIIIPLCIFICPPTQTYLPSLSVRVSRSWSEAQSAPAGAEDGSK